MTERRASLLYSSFAVVALLGSACSGGDKSSPDITTSIPEVTSPALEDKSYLYPDIRLGVSVWDIAGGDYYQRLFTQEGEGDVAIKHNRDLITIRANYDLNFVREKLDTTKVLAYMYNLEGVGGDTPISSIDKLADIFAPGGTAYLDFRMLGFSRPGRILMADTSVDGNHIYFQFKNETDEKDHWILIFRPELFKQDYLNPGDIVLVPFENKLLRFVDKPRISSN